MKNLVKVVLSLFLMAWVMYAEPVSQSGEKDGYAVSIKTEKSLVVGSNDFFVTLSKDDMIVKDAKVKIKVFMPEMPGMPYMDYQAKAKYLNGAYKMVVNFSMGGTWQYHLKFKTQDNKVHTIRGSVNL